ncbi:MAG: DEAD/DEAH box helicase [Bacteroidetes bacterium]|nr:MAG: DEAD/DEAH box helicase [Bacteroidota bacterium]
MGKNVWGTERYFKMIEETEDDIIIPRGFIGKLIRFFREHTIEYDFNDERQKANAVLFSPSIELREHQKPVLEGTKKKDFGVIVAPPGSGKTIIGLSVIANKQQPALIIVHRKQLADQWAERIESFLGIPKREIGKIGQGKNTLGKHITIAMIQSLEKAIESEQAEKLLKSFGTIIVDECHHVPADTFRNTISKFHTFYLYGLTATPFRKYNDGKLIFIHLGDIISEVEPQDISDTPGAKIIVRNTELSIPFNAKTDKFETVSKVLVHDSGRNKLILDDVVAELNKGKKAVIVTERKEHIDTLHQYLKQKYEAITLSGDDSYSNKKTKWEILKEGNFQVLITTGQYFGEGSDLQKIECLFLVYPFSFEGKLIQYIGRAQRSEITPVIYDYRDHKIEYLEKLFQKRNAYYKKFYLSGTLFSQPDSKSDSDTSTFVYEQRINIPIEQLEFRFGAVAFKHLIPQINTEQEFEVENNEMRPEFDVLKPYFSKILKTKKVKIDVLAKFHNGVPVIHTASSHDLSKINREIIDSVKFQFVSKGIFGKIPKGEDNLLDLNQVQDEQKSPLYGSEKELLDDILKNKNVKHHRQLVYLSQKHESNILKLRFVLYPFSFVFLLSGKHQYHVIWETLDTEEATYVWHVHKNIPALKNKLKEIDSYIGKIRTTGRQEYLGSQTDGFSRIVHDYSDERKGFVIWKDLLEERLT